MVFGKIANVLRGRGDLEEALRILREEVLPAYERMGLTRELIKGRRNLALALLQRGGPVDRAEARRLLETALAAGEELALPEAGTIREILLRHDLREVDHPSGSGVE